MSQKVKEESLPATAPPAHSGFSKGSLGLYAIIIMIGTFVCDKNNSLTVYNTSCGDGAMGKPCAMKLKVAGSSLLGNH